MVDVLAQLKLINVLDAKPDTLKTLLLPHLNAINVSIIVLPVQLPLHVILAMLNSTKMPMLPSVKHAQLMLLHAQVLPQSYVLILSMPLPCQLMLLVSLPLKSNSAFHV
jgi:hypothetical protein